MESIAHPRSFNRNGLRAFYVAMAAFYALSISALVQDTVRRGADPAGTTTIEVLGTR